jgi:rod shape determining protein RodA
MQTETRHEQFERHSFLGNFLRKLHVDIPLFVTLVLISILSFEVA